MKFKRRPVVANDIYHCIQADLIDYSRISGSNNRYSYILVVIDVLSKMLWTRAMLDKTAKTTSEHLDSIISSMPRVPVFFSSDKGNEFSKTNRYTKAILIDKYKMHIFTMAGRTKGSVVERVNRTLKTNLQRHFTETNSKRWVDVLQKFTTNYNRNYHSTIRMAPVDVTAEKVKQILSYVYPNSNKWVSCSPNPFKVGDRVRIPVQKKNIFVKGYAQSKI